MNSADLIARARMGAFIGDPTTAPDYTDAWVLAELNDQQTTLFEATIVNARSGYWRKSYQFLITPGRATYTVPPRSVAGGFDKIDIAWDSNLNFVPLQEYSEDDARLAEQGPPAPVCGFILRGDQIVLLPTPDSSAFTLRPSYYSRPSRLCTPQSGGATGGTDQGRITVWNPTTRVATVNALPKDMETAGTPNLITGQLVDIVRPTGWHEIQVIDAPQTLGGLNITIGGTDDVSTVAVGDYVRIAQQTDWANLPDDYARCLADACAIKILLQLGDDKKAGSLTAVMGSDLGRFRDLLTPRVKNTGGTDIIAPFGMYRGNGVPWQVKFP